MQYNHLNVTRNNRFYSAVEGTYWVVEHVDMSGATLREVNIFEQNDNMYKYRSVDWEDLNTDYQRGWNGY